LMLIPKNMRFSQFKNFNGILKKNFDVNL